MFRLADAEEMDAAMMRLRSLSGRIPTLKSLKVGRDSNRGPAAYDVVLMTEHDDRAALRAYAEHPVHMELLEWLKPRWTDRAVVDTEDLG
jgi:hypothetical protein